MTVPPAADLPPLRPPTRPAWRLAAVLAAGWPTRRRLLALAGLGVVVAVALYYPVGAWRVSVIDDDPAFLAPGVAQPASKAVAVAAALIRREIDVHGWTPNKPFFMPAAILDDMPNYQKGLIAGIGRFALEMDEQIGRTPVGADTDLGRAAGLLQYPATIWMIDPAVPWAPTVSTEKQYRNAARAFEAYNQRLALGTASFARRPEVLQAVLERLAKDVAASAATLDQPATRGAGWFDWHADEPFYAAKGRAYALLMVLKGLGDDYAAVLAERNLGDAWQGMLASLAGAATLRPWVVLAGGPASSLVPNHPANLGFALLRAGSRMTALADVLR